MTLVLRLGYLAAAAPNLTVRLPGHIVRRLENMLPAREPLEGSVPKLAVGGGPVPGITLG